MVNSGNDCFSEETASFSLSQPDPLDINVVVSGCAGSNSIDVSINNADDVFILQYYNTINNDIFGPFAIIEDAVTNIDNVPTGEYVFQITNANCYQEQVFDLNDLESKKIFRSIQRRRFS